MCYNRIENNAVFDVFQNLISIFFLMFVMLFDHKALNSKRSVR